MPTPKIWGGYQNWRRLGLFDFDVRMNTVGDIYLAKALCRFAPFSVWNGDLVISTASFW